MRLLPFCESRGTQDAQTKAGVEGILFTGEVGDGKKYLRKGRYDQPLLMLAADQ